MYIKLMAYSSMSLNHANGTGYWAWTITTLIVTITGSITHCYSTY